MRNKVKLSTIFLTVFLALTIPLSTTTANAMTFENPIPAFSLYYDNQNVEINGNVKYVIDAEGKANQFSKYTINAESENVTLYIPFVANPFTIPQIDIDVEGEICYGEPYGLFTDKLNYEFYTTNIGEMTGTIYTLNSSNESFTIDFTMLENQNYIYRLTNNRTEISDDRHHTYTVNDAKPDIPYEIFIINGDCAEFSSSAEFTKETVTIKDYIARYFEELNDYFEPLRTASTDFLYAITKQALAKNINYDFFKFFLDSYTQQRLIAYKIEVQPSCTIEYSMPVDVQKNTSFNPAIYMTEVTATGNYDIDYTIELNSSLPFIIESSSDVKQQADNVYAANNVNDDFYFVFSSSKTPASLYGNNNENNTLRIVAACILSLAICVLIACTVLLINFIMKYKKLPNDIPLRTDMKWVFKIILVGVSILALIFVIELCCIYLAEGINIWEYLKEVWEWYSTLL